MAKAYDTGVGLRKNLDLNWTEAIDYYNKAIHDLEDEDSEILHLIDILFIFPKENF